MFKQLLAWVVLLCLLSFNVLAKSSESIFAKSNTLNIGKDISWKIDKGVVRATKSMVDNTGIFYHLQFDNKYLKLLVSSDAAGLVPKKFNQFQINNVKIDGKQSQLFKWCLNNQQRHNRFLQEGLSVEKDICVVDSETGTFIMRLNQASLQALQDGRRLSITTKVFRTPLELNYDISDFKDMYLALNVKPKTAVTSVNAGSADASKPSRKCWAGAPPKYRFIKSVEYDCDDVVGKKDAQLWITKLVNIEENKQRKLKAEKDKQQKLLAQKKQKALAKKVQQEKLIQAEAVAIAASEAKQAAIGDEITAKMLKICDKFWRKGEHRCYCQKYIEHAPKSIQSSSSCD